MNTTNVLFSAGTRGVYVPGINSRALAKAVTLPGCDHFSCIGHPLFKASVFDFFDGWLD